MSLLYDRYYDRNATIDIKMGDDVNYSDNTPNFIYGCTDSNAENFNANANRDDGSCTFAQTNNTQQTNNTDDGTCVGICENTVKDNAQSKEEENLMYLSIVMVVIFSIAGIVIFISKNKDESEIGFVPEMPPIEPPESN